MSLDLRMRQPGHRLVGDQELGLGRHGARELELAHLDLGEVAREFVGAVDQADEAEQLGAARVGLRGSEMAALARGDRVEQRHPQIVGDRHAHERARQLEAAREPEPGALVRGQPVELPAVEAHRAGLVGERAAQAVDQRALARSVRPDQADALARRDVEVDAVERDEAAEALAEAFDLEEGAHGTSSLSSRRSGARAQTMPTTWMIMEPSTATVAASSAVQPPARSQAASPPKTGVSLVAGNRPQDGADDRKSHEPHPTDRLPPRIGEEEQDEPEREAEIQRALALSGSRRTSAKVERRRAARNPSAGGGRGGRRSQDQPDDAVGRIG